MPLLDVHCITINALDPQRLAAFWATLLDGTERDAGNGFVLVEPNEGGMRLLFQQADAATPEPGWIHLDCSVAEREFAVAEICRLGGSLVERRSDNHADWIVMADPEGNPFCI